MCDPFALVGVTGAPPNTKSSSDGPVSTTRCADGDEGAVVNAGSATAAVAVAVADLRGSGGASRGSGGAPGKAVPGETGWAATGEVAVSTGGASAVAVPLLLPSAIALRRRPITAEGNTWRSSQTLTVRVRRRTESASPVRSMLSTVGGLRGDGDMGVLGGA